MITAVFIDGAYLSKILRRYNYPKVRYENILDWIVPRKDLFRAYYYDCLPYQNIDPTDEERHSVLAKTSFFNGLSSIPRFKVKLGRLAYRGINNEGQPIFVQKGVDLQMGLDIANVTSRGIVQCVALVTGDSDFIPAVRLAQSQAMITRLVHGPSDTYHRALWRLVDERFEITEEILLSCK